jgi:hypothetical protein
MEHNPNEPQYHDRYSVNIEDLADIQDVVIDTSLPREERIRSYLEQIKNPHCYRCGDTIVRVSFDNSGSPLEELIRDYLVAKSRYDIHGTE